MPFQDSSIKQKGKAIGQPVHTSSEEDSLLLESAEETDDTRAIASPFPASTTVGIFERGGEVGEWSDASTFDVVRPKRYKNSATISWEEIGSVEPVEMISDCYKIASNRSSGWLPCVDCVFVLCSAMGWRHVSRKISSQDARRKSKVRLDTYESVFQIPDLQLSTPSKKLSCKRRRRQLHILASSCSYDYLHSHIQP